MFDALAARVIIVETHEEENAIYHKVLLISDRSLSAIRLCMKSRLQLKVREKYAFAFHLLRLLSVTWFEQT